MGSGKKSRKAKRKKREKRARKRIRRLIREECSGIEDLLLRKNREYGNSALDPVRIFSRAGSLDQIRTRIDDKLSRIRELNCGTRPKIVEDTEQDLIGYLILLRVGRQLGL